ncbi:hypothetical protein V565_223910 [Rhizoctonia solani 123E]|uniref:Zn-finger protein n=1 Tax=Rhizoctonia solani 123E TaxID=1423351 RepID=A0A074RKY8_9AGAM|nr:hypothetical protein V565_223910 [Rhizoctonia solani 123E]
MPRASRTHRCPHCPASYPTRRGLSRHLTQSKSCRKKSLKLLNKGFRKRTCRHRTIPENEPTPAVEPEGSHSQRVPDVQLASDASNLGVRVEGENAPENEPIVAEDEVIDISDDEEDWPSVEGVEVVEEAMDIDQGSFSQQNSQANADTESPPPQYLPYEPPEPPEPFDSATHVENHPDRTAGGVLRWVVNVEAPSPYAIILEDRDIFEIAHWLANQPLTDEGRDAFLRMARNQDLPWKNVRQFNDSIDKMPHGPGWYRRRIKIRGDRGSLIVEVWLRNALHVVRQLIGNPRFRLYMRFAPVRHWTTALRQARVYGEMWTGNWWWEIQNLLGEGATVCPIILASDKTQLTRLAGGKQAWPVYLMIGNISKKIRRRPGEGASILVGYIPADNLETCISNEDQRRIARWKLFHKAMDMIMEPIRAVSRVGEEMVCADGGVRRVHPILAAYMGDLPEQLLVTCTQQHRCPICTVPSDDKDDINKRYPRRSRQQTLDAIGDYKHHHRGTIDTLGIREITNPFWATMPYTDIFAAMAPDLLHQLDKGVFGEYLVKWGQNILGTGEFDRRLKGMPRFQGMRHFKYGIEPIPKSQWTGNEAKALGRVYLPLVSGSGYTDFTRAARAITDFQMRARLPELTDYDLGDLKNDLRVFHTAKNIFIQTGAREQALGFAGLTKLHMLEHYAEWIYRMGTPDGYSTEISERLHIPCVKEPWRATNHVDATEQMTTRLQRRETWAIACARMYEAGLLPQSLRAHYESRGRVDYQPRSNGNFELDEDDGEDENEVEGIVIGNAGTWMPGQIWHPAPSVYLAKTPPSGTRKVNGSYLAEVYGAVRIVEATRDFLSSIDPSYHNLPLDENSHFRVWSRFRLHHDRLPFLQSLPPRIDRIRAFPSQYDDYGAVTRQGYMDTILYLAEPEYQGLRRYRAGRVRTIFRLPRHLAPIYDKPLLYVEVFRPFSVPNNYPDHRLCTTSPEVSNGTRVHAVIPLSTVRAACHLAPQYHRMADADNPQPLTSADDLLSMADNFYLSRHNSEFTFALLDHWRRAEVENA